MVIEFSKCVPEYSDAARGCVFTVAIANHLCEVLDGLIKDTNWPSSVGSVSAPTYVARANSANVISISLCLLPRSYRRLPFTTTISKVSVNRESYLVSVTQMDGKWDNADLRNPECLEIISSAVSAHWFELMRSDTRWVRINDNNVACYEKEAF